MHLSEIARIKRKRHRADVEMLFRTGSTLMQIGKIYGVTKQRVYDWLAQNKVNPRCGGNYLQTTFRIRDKAKAKYYKYMKPYRCYRGEFEMKCRELRYKGYGVNLHHDYRQQKYNAKLRGIPFQISFIAWADIWESSGCLLDRGRGGGYVMSRHGDIGGYTINNVQIITARQNHADAWKYKRWSPGRKMVN